jgi:hypothetical protein
MTANMAQTGQRLTAPWFNTNIPGHWQAITPLASWSNVAGDANFQCRMFNSVTLQVVGVLNGGTITNGTVIGVLPATINGVASIPVSSQIFEGTPNLPTTLSNVAFQITVVPSGNITVFGVPSGTTRIGFSFLVSLDA